MKYNYRTQIKTPVGLKVLRYNINGRKATYNLMGTIKTIDVNPLIVFDCIVSDIADNLFTFFPNEKF